MADTISLAGSEWDRGNGSKQFVKFSSNDRISGFAGCNRFFGSYRVEGERIEISRIGASRRYCGKDIMARERQWLGMLRKAQTFHSTYLKLTLIAAGGSPIITLQRRNFEW